MCCWVWTKSACIRKPNAELTLADPTVMHCPPAYFLSLLSSTPRWIMYCRACIRIFNAGAFHPLRFIMTKINVLILIFNNTIFFLGPEDADGLRVHAREQTVTNDFSLRVPGLEHGTSQATRHAVPHEQLLQCSA